MTEPAARPAQASATRSILILVGLVLGVIGLWWIYNGGGRGPWSAEGATFVKNETCASCHEDQQHHWVGSHHDLAMDKATAETVLGDFDDVTYDHFGETTRFFRKGERFFVHTADADGTPRDHEVKYTFGVTPLQQYLVEAADGKLQCLQVSWDVANKRWFHIQTEPVPPGDMLHWTGMQFRANFMCIECHVTNMERGYNAETNSYETTWSDIDVGCQACHGPGSEHVAWAAKYKKAAGDDDPMGLAVRFRGTDADVQIEHCARCHARRTIVSEPYTYGAPLLDHYAPSLLVEPLYHADGQINDEVYVYGSFLQARKHKRGVRCSNCHDPHSARLLAEGNDLCVKCHQLQPPEEFPTLRKAEYDTPEHHFHKAGTAGSKCVDCHMMAKTYMGVDPRRDHSFRIPRPDLSAQIGSPDACTACHDDKTLAWAAAEVAKRYPDAAKRPHYGLAFAAVRAGMREAQRPLESIAMDLEQPGIVRATAVHYLARFPLSDVAPTVAMLLGDDDALVRATAVESFARLFPRSANVPLRARKAQMLVPLLEDPSRLVRTEAARALADVPRANLPAESHAAFDKALAEFVARQTAVGGQPSSHLNLAVLAESQGDAARAEAEYRRALVLDRLFLPARFNLAHLLNARGRNDEAATVLQELVRLSPENGEAWYSLGLLQAERGEQQAAVEALSNASRLLPRRARVRYNLALALQMADQKDAGGLMLEEAHRLSPRDPDILAALVIHHIQTGAFEIASGLLDRLDEIAPRGSRLPGELRKQLQAAQGD